MLKKKVEKLHKLIKMIALNQKQSSRDVLAKRCHENMQQIYSRTTIPKCDFNKIALQTNFYQNCQSLRFLIGIKLVTSSACKFVP